MELIEQIWSALHTATLPDLGVWSYVILFVLIFIEGPAITMTAGAMAGAGILRFDLVFFTAVVSNTLADYTWYLLGYFGSQHPLLLRLRWIQHNEKLIQRLTSKIQRRASHLFLVAKASVGIMSIPVLVASGIARVSWLRLFVISVVFEPIWNGALIYAGSHLGSYINALDRGLRYFALFATFSLFIVFAALYRRFFQHVTQINDFAP
jgi:membrane protein DedA with SNARE-associated domain